MNKVMVIIGAASGWLVDLRGLQNICKNFDVTAIGLDCAYYDHIDYFATYHIEDIKPYYRKRKNLGLNLDYKVVSHTDDYIKYNKEKTFRKLDLEGLRVDIVIPYKKPSGSSALLGVFLALKLGYEKIVLCGCPMQGIIVKTNSKYDLFQKGWIPNKDMVMNKVKSMSGWTKEFLGEPTKEWIED